GSEQVIEHPTESMSSLHAVICNLKYVASQSKDLKQVIEHTT
ncbi:17983_t:CDS:1, partial [Racocetra fulgida]